MYLAEHIYHIYNQGNNRQKIFNTHKDYLTFLTLYKRLFIPCCSTLSWCLMPNHFHFMIHADRRSVIQIKQGSIVIDALSNSIRKLLSGYARIFNSQNDRSGSLFRQKTRSKCVTELCLYDNGEFQLEDYYTNCINYIHFNPVEADLVVSPEDWEFSSFRDFAGMRNDSFCNLELARKFCGFEGESLRNISLKKPDKRIIDLLG